MMKHVAADAKEKLGNVTAKAEEKMDSAKASATEKTDKVMAHDKAGKLEAKERKHERQAEAQKTKDLKQVENARGVAQAKDDIAESKAASHDTHNSKLATELGTATPQTNAGLTQQAAGAGSAIGPGIWENNLVMISLTSWIILVSFIFSWSYGIGGSQFWVNLCSFCKSHATLFLCYVVVKNWVIQNMVLNLVRMFVLVFIMA